MAQNLGTHSRLVQIGCVICFSNYQLRSQQGIIHILFDRVALISSGEQMLTNAIGVKTYMLVSVVAFMADISGLE